MSTSFSLASGTGTPTFAPTWSTLGVVNPGTVVAFTISGAVTPADISDAVPPVGICTAMTDGAATVAFNGQIATGLSGLTRGSVYWLSAVAGQLTSTQPNTPAYAVGIALSATELLVDLTLADLSVSGGAGTVTSFGITSSDSSFTVDGGPVTTSGSIALSLNTVAVNKGGTGVSTSFQPFSPTGNIVVATSATTATTAETPNTYKNELYNPQMAINQRAAGTVTADGDYPVDRWVFRNTTTATASALQSTTAPDGFTNSFRYNVTVLGAATSGQIAAVSQAIEAPNMVNFAFGTASARTISLSFWVQSTVAGTYCAAITNGPTQTRSWVAEYTINAANTWERKTITIPGDITGWTVGLTGAVAGMYVYFDLGSSSSFNATANTWTSAFATRTASQTNLVGLTGSWYVTGVQLENSSVATAFEARPAMQEIALCQRYYTRWSCDAGQTDVAFGAGQATTATNGIVYLKYPQALCKTPVISTSSLSAPSTLQLFDGAGTVRQITAVSATTSLGESTATINFTSSGLTTGRPYLLMSNTNASAFIALSAEI